MVTGADGQEDDDVKEKPDDRLDEEMSMCIYVQCIYVHRGVMVQ